jgi:hypothetical protein
MYVQIRDVKDQEARTCIHQPLALLRFGTVPGVCFDACFRGAIALL